MSHQPFYPQWLPGTFMQLEQILVALKYFLGKFTEFKLIVEKKKDPHHRVKTLQINKS